MDITLEQIDKFLNGSDPQEHIIAVETDYNTDIAYLIINDKEKGKIIVPKKYKAFFWVKEEATKLLYGGNRGKILREMKLNNIKAIKLKTDNNGYEPERMKNGYKYLFTCKGSNAVLQRFFTDGGLNINSEDDVDTDEGKVQQRSLVFKLSPTEQYLIQTGKRLFKGYEDLNDLLHFTFDIETEGLDPNKHSITKIGIKTNKGYEKILDIDLKDKEDEIIKLIEFFNIIDELKPDIIKGYNSENFDWWFIEERLKRFKINIKKICKTLSKSHSFKRKPNSKLKLGGETEDYTQTYIWGYNIVDGSHAVRRAQAIDSSMESWTLKYITKYSKINKKNRVYIKGNQINTLANDKVNKYWFNDENGEWGIYNGGETDLQIVSGDYIVNRYLIDDLWETEEVDKVYSRSNFFLQKIIPTNYSRLCTMGTSAIWKLILSAWSFENGLAVPAMESKKDFTGGLSRLLRVGYSKESAKLDYAALYPKTELTHDIKPELDISGAMMRLLEYVVVNRDKYKELKGEYSELKNKYEDELKENYTTYLSDKISELENKIQECAVLEKRYDKLQLPLKILANSFFGSFGAPPLFPWGDYNSAEETTCRGRQYLRLMVEYFYEKHNCIPIVGDTDGFNFELSDEVKKFEYTPKGTHTLTQRFKDKKLIGIEAAVAEYNEKYMIGYMGLDIDEICEATINFKRKNYATLIRGKVKKVGNSIKSKVMETYIKEFMDEALKLLLNDKGYDFIELYYDTVDKIFNYQMPVVKLASKSKVKQTVESYKKRKPDKNGKAPAKQAHMELIIENDIKINLGDVIYYLNTGTAKSHGDVKVIIDKETKKKVTSFNCKLVSADMIENNPDYTEVGYNVARYISKLNSRIKTMLVCFHPDIRNNILISVVKDKKTKLNVLQQRNYFTKEQTKLVSGYPLDAEDQDSYEDLMKMEDKEIRFWKRVDKIPNNIDEEVWFNVLKEYDDKIKNKPKEDKEQYLKIFNNLMKDIDIIDLKDILENGFLNEKLSFYFKLKEGYIVENKNEIKIISLDELSGYTKEISDRSKFFKEHNIETNPDRYEKWLDEKEKRTTFDSKYSIIDEIKKEMLKLN